VKISRLVIVACCAAFAAVSAFAQEQQSDISLLANPVFKKDCAKCHGKTAGGRHFGGPSLHTDKVAAMSDDDLRNIITNGQKKMPKFAGKLTPDQIDQLAAQIKAFNAK
jgi:mono/diheme cytochrome c family protein